MDMNWTKENHHSLQWCLMRAGFYSSQAKDVEAAIRCYYSLNVSLEIIKVLYSFFVGFYLTKSSWNG